MHDLEVLENTKILVIDDEIVNLMILEELLGEEEPCYHVDYESCPRQAIELYKLNTYHLVLLDISMPDIDGFGVLAAFKEINLELMPPVLVLTSLNNRDTKLQALRKGAKDFLTKPFDHDEVLYRVRNLIELHQSKLALNDANSHLEAKVMQRTRELELAKIEVVQRLATAADYRDTETSAHTLRVGLVSEFIGLSLGLDADYCTILRQAAPMHDIGKLGIPDSILLKNGKLTDEEMTIMREHVLIGANILKGSPSKVLNETCIITEHHHERWDGLGYPKGLKGEDIPLSARIVILADIFDALSNARPYKAAWSYEKILAYFSEENGKIFDPQIMAVFLDNWNEICLLKEKYND